MNDDRSIDEIFCTAIEIESSSDRQSWLNQACGDDAELRRQVDRLLEAHFRGGSIVDAPAHALDVTVNQPRLETPGIQIGPYKLLQQIGEGGMGTVFMAEQTQPVKRKVALKLIKAGMDSRQIIARFEAERQALAMMDHVNIARVLDAGTIGFAIDDFRFPIDGKQPEPSAIENQKSKIENSGRPYFVMELIHGVPITKYCDDNHLTPRQRLELFVPVCQAIQHAHQKGIIHRDIKPSNVMVTLYDGKPVPKVIDFGVAKATEQKLTERSLFTQYGTMVGTLEYMSPEQAEMSALGIDTRSDIYSLGVLLYELLTGSTPLSHKRMKEAGYAEILRLIKDEEPPKPSTRLSESGEALALISAQRHTEPAKLSKLMRGELDWIVMKCLEKDRNRRYETANGFAADVQRYLNDEPVQACPPSTAYRLRKFARRNKSILATAGVLGLALVLGTVVSMWQAIRATKAEGLAQMRLQAETKAQNATRKQLSLTLGAEGKATRRLYDARLAQAKAGSNSRRIGQRFDSLDALVEATKIAGDLKLAEGHFLELRNAAIACLALPDLRVAKEWSGWPAGSVWLDIDATLERYARTDRQGVVSIRRVADDSEIYRLPGRGPEEKWSRFSPDGQFLAVWRSHVQPFHQIWKLSGQKPVLLLDGSMGAFAFSPDSRQLALALPDGSVCLHDLPSGREVKRLKAGPRVWMLAFHPNNSQLAISCPTGVQIRDINSGNLLADLAHPAGAMLIAWHPDGNTLAVDGGDQFVHIWDVAARKAIARLEGHKGGGINFAYNNAGDLLASRCWDGILRLWNPRTGRELFQTPAGFASIRFSSDDQRLGASVEGDKLRIWKVAAASGYRTLVREDVEGHGYYHTGSIHPDGRLLAVGMLDGFDMWDLVTGKHLASIKLPTPNMSLLFDPSGELLTSGTDALRRWPIQAEPESGMVRVGPPIAVPLPAAGSHIAHSREGRVLASAQYNGGLVLHRDRSDRPIPLGPLGDADYHADVRFVAVSTDGRWVATGSHSSTKVKVWQAQNGKLQKELPVETGSMVIFSPNGKWLATTGDGCRLWAIDSWEEGPHIGGGTAFTPVAFTPDGKILAVETGSGVVRLVDPDTGREYARLEDPNQDRAGALTFSRDGTELVTTSNDSHSIHVWDLRTIREQLSKMGLDWNLPPYGPREPSNQPPLHVQVDRGNLDALTKAHEFYQQGYRHGQASQWDKAIAAFAQAIELDPQNSRSHNNLAWLLATCPDATFRDPARAVELAKTALELAPNAVGHWNTLGAAQYRAGDWPATIEALTKSMELRNGGDSFDWYFLAMAHWQSDHKEEARKWYDQAVEWMEKNKPEDEELKRFHTEAAALLGVEEENNGEVN